MKSLFIYSSKFRPPESNFDFPAFTNQFSFFEDIDSLLVAEKIDSRTIDSVLNKFVLKYLETDVFDIIYVPAIIGDIYTNFYGIRLLWHLRLTQAIGQNRFVPIVFYTSNTYEEMAGLNDLSPILLTKNTFLSPMNFSAIQSFAERNLKSISEKEYNETILDRLTLKIPQSYYDSHSIANEWGVHRLNEVADTKVPITENSELFSSLYFKWLSAKNNVAIRNNDVQEAEDSGRNQIKELGINVVGKIKLSEKDRNKKRF